MTLNNIIMIMIPMSIKKRISSELFIKLNVPPYTPKGIDHYLIPDTKELKTGIARQDDKKGHNRRMEKVDDVYINLYIYKWAYRCLFVCLSVCWYVEG